MDQYFTYIIVPLLVTVFGVSSFGLSFARTVYTEGKINSIWVISATGFEDHSLLGYIIGSHLIAIVICYSGNHMLVPFAIVSVASSFILMLLSRISVHSFYKSTS
ncbi:hypothetical protein DFJ63DRAFT_316783 [Scheffersomyces coipomensis]|uniref:uncharacterized protein n=1 Tax=Scheffersomyces coipomensis TaxID=1788519 RepID=UPI00315DB8B9